MNSKDTSVPLSTCPAHAFRATNKLVIDFAVKDLAVALTGFSGAEQTGRWTNGRSAEIVLHHLDLVAPVLLLNFELRAFVVAAKLPQQRVTVSVNGRELAAWTIGESSFRRRVLAIQNCMTDDAGPLTVRFDLPDCSQPKALGLNGDERFLGLLLRRLSIEGVADMPPTDSLLWQYGRPVGPEAAKSFDRRMERGFWSRFVTGPNVIDVGFRGSGSTVLPILEGALGVDLDYPGYDGQRLPFEDGSQDLVFSSHCLEHIPNCLQTIQDWYRVTRLNGHIITIVPSAALYERKRRPPSRWNRDHKRFYTPSSLLAEFEQALAPNSFRIRYLEENDEGYCYDDAPDLHPRGSYEIVLVVEKIKAPAWSVES